MFLTLETFLGHFPEMPMSHDEFTRRFTVMYSHPQSLADIFALVPPPPASVSRKAPRPIIRNPDTDRRYINRERVIEYFYEIIIRNRHLYLRMFYQAYFEFKDPRTLAWGDRAGILSESATFAPYNVISLQKNDASRRLIRNIFYLELLDETKITNTVKSHVSFWASLSAMYNKLELEDRFFAPSSIDLFLKDKVNARTGQPTAAFNHNNLFYLFQAYQPKASIFNPYSICWILNNVIDQALGRPGQSLFTPVLSWGSYLPAVMHSQYREYVGVDVMPKVCDGVSELAHWYTAQGSPYSSKTVDIRCQPSESLLKDREFLGQYEGHFDAILVCPPYFDMEIYAEGQQSIQTFPEYADWLTGYWEATVKMCAMVARPDAVFALIANDYNTLEGETRYVSRDLEAIVAKYFYPYLDRGEAGRIYYLQNRVSPLRVNAKDRTERLYLFKGVRGSEAVSAAPKRRLKIRSKISSD